MNPLRPASLLLCSLLVVGCTTLPMSPHASDNEVETNEAAATNGPAPAVQSVPPEADVDARGGEPSEERCVVFCYGVEVAKAKATVDDAEAYTVAQTENADAVLASLNPDLVRCYRSRVRVAPRTEDAVTFEILVGEGGRVRSVGTIGGDRLGAAKACMIDVLRTAVFAAPHGGGTVTIKAPFKLSLQGDDGV